MVATQMRIAFLAVDIVGKTAEGKEGGLVPTFRAYKERACTTTKRCRSFGHWNKCVQRHRPFYGNRFRTKRAGVKQGIGTQSVEKDHVRNHLKSEPPWPLSWYGGDILVINTGLFLPHHFRFFSLFFPLPHTISFLPSSPLPITLNVNRRT